MKIEEVNGEFIITKTESGVEKQQQADKSPQKRLTASRNTLNSN